MMWRGGGRRKTDQERQLPLRVVWGGGGCCVAVREQVRWPPPRVVWRAGGCRSKGLRAVAFAEHLVARRRPPPNKTRAAASRARAVARRLLQP